MEDFLKADGLSRIIFYFQEVENLPDAGNLSYLVVSGRKCVFGSGEGRGGEGRVGWGWSQALYLLHIHSSCLSKDTS